jgi:hypothetical protein
MKEIKRMKKSFSGVLVAALALAGVIGTSSKADAALIIDFDNVTFDGGTITSLAGGNFSGSNIVFDSILLKDTTAGTTLAGVQCGVATTTTSATLADTCKLNFNTLTNTFAVTSPTGLWAIGPDFLAYTADRGGLIAGTAGQNVLTGSFSQFNSFSGPGGNSLFVGAGTDTKNAALLAFFGLPASSSFTFANTNISSTSNGNVTEADLINIVNVPEPASMALFGLGLMGVGIVQRRRAAKQ